MILDQQLKDSAKDSGQTIRSVKNVYSLGLMSIPMRSK